MVINSAKSNSLLYFWPCRNEDVPYSCHKKIIHLLEFCLNRACPHYRTLYPLDCYIIIYEYHLQPLIFKSPVPWCNGMGAISVVISSSKNIHSLSSSVKITLSQGSKYIHKSCWLAIPPEIPTESNHAKIMWRNLPLRPCAVETCTQNSCI